MTIKWWEKTVEYLFVKKHVSETNLVMPLDGKDESQGDTILGNKNQWILIEFKKDKDSIVSEKKKFHDFNAAYNQLKDRDGHHHIIYGSPVRQGIKVTLALKSQTYFSFVENNSIESALQTGIKFEVFHQYVKEFISFKKSTEKDSGGVVLDTNSNVIGVSSTGEVIECMTMKEYVIKYIPELAPVQRVTNTNTLKR
ncbi:hypothetical protein WG68_12685 [Arsukibacterium ikkense]|uniref:Uncharacterized protein n=1 Tax=Arsukibacterium ikkense TaxID=336831 RepID=A0A0M2V2X4_9GAMM|nr:hypothetical protein [Arsukibacterium ikkense]KKO44991.1 hypothetical protein WG68_12685 [Arsukibacterium ikkense]